jgi:hypothetical protein
MADDLEAFLRQAAQRRAERKKTPARKQTRPEAQTQPAQPQRPTPQRRPSAPPDDGIEIIEADAVPDDLGRLTTHVNTSAFGRRAEHLGEEVGLADEELEARLHAKFDHRLGSLDDAPGMPGSPGSLDAAGSDIPSIAEEIANLLKQPDTVRNAIVLSEILSPPHHRW